MANTLTAVGDLATEVADLLRHDNMDTRLLTWLTSTFNDIVQRAPVSLFVKSSPYSYSLGSEAAGGLGQITANPFCLVVVMADNSVYVPRYVTPIDYARIAHKTDGGALVTGTIPLFWTMGPGGVGSVGHDGIYVYPVLGQNAVFNLFSMAKYQSTPLGTGSYFELPYHFEHVLVFGAASMGARFIRPELYPIFKAEYEQALRDLYLIMDYKPDAVPVMRSVMGPYDKAPQEMGMPRFPANI